MSVNKVILVGNLGKDPELKYTPSGTAVCTFSIATTERYKNKQGEQQDKTEWHNIVTWAGLAEVCGKYLKKGQQVYIDGRIQTRTYDDRDGNKRYVTEIVASEMTMLGRKQDQEQEQRPPQSQHRPEGNEPLPGGVGGLPFNPDEDIPFMLPMMYFQDGKL